MSLRIRQVIKIQCLFSSHIAALKTIPARCAFRFGDTNVIRWRVLERDVKRCLVKHLIKVLDINLA